MPPGNSYGTLSSENNGQERVANGTDEESVGLLVNKADPKGILKSFQQHLNGSVKVKWSDTVLLSCYVITGLLDASSIFSWGAFVSMQTGNTVYLGLGIAAPNDGNRWIRSLISIVCFCFGSFFFARFHRFLAARKRWVLITSYSLQLVLITVAAVMTTLKPHLQHSSGPITAWVAVPIALVAVQAGGQFIISRVLKFNALTGVVLTSIYGDLVSDENLFGGLTKYPERNRRAAAPILLLIGAIIGGLFAHSDFGITGALWTAVILKSLIMSTWFFWPAEKGES